MSLFNFLYHQPSAVRFRVCEEQVIGQPGFCWVDSGPSIEGDQLALLLNDGFVFAEHLEPKLEFFDDSGSRIGELKHWLDTPLLEQRVVLKCAELLLG